MNSGECIRFTDDIEYLRILFDSMLSLDTQIQKVSGIWQLEKISSIKGSLSKSNLETFIPAFMSSYLDYSNILYVVYQKVDCQIVEAPKYCNQAYFQCAVSSFTELHWLNIEQRTNEY